MAMSNNHRVIKMMTINEIIHIALVVTFPTPLALTKSGSFLANVFTQFSCPKRAAKCIAVWPSIPPVGNIGDVRAVAMEHGPPIDDFPVKGDVQSICSINMSYYLIKRIDDVQRWTFKMVINMFNQITKGYSKTKPLMINPHFGILPRDAGNVFDAAGHGVLIQIDLSLSLNE